MGVHTQTRARSWTSSVASLAAAVALSLLTHTPGGMAFTPAAANRALTARGRGRGRGRGSVRARKMTAMAATAAATKGSVVTVNWSVSVDGGKLPAESQVCIHTQTQTQTPVCIHTDTHARARAHTHRSLTRERFGWWSELVATSLAYMG